jgi:NAD(P)-dependent dehydrogenase (short-subunit alcohol dehydrogenase family)
MLAAVENRFGNVLKGPTEIEWLTDNGSGYTAEKTRTFASGIGLKPLTTPVCSPQSNGMAESFVQTKRILNHNDLIILWTGAMVGNPPKLKNGIFQQGFCVNEDAFSSRPYVVNISTICALWLFYQPWSHLTSASLKALPLIAAYRASKAEVNAFTESLALELERFGVRTHLVLPGSAPDTRFRENTHAHMHGLDHEAYSSFLFRLHMS